jgi:hypothetical protein
MRHMALAIFHKGRIKPARQQTLFIYASRRCSGDWEDFTQYDMGCVCSSLEQLRYGYPLQRYALGGFSTKPIKKPLREGTTLFTTVDGLHATFSGLDCVTHVSIVLDHCIPRRGFAEITGDKRASADIPHIHIERNDIGLLITTEHFTLSRE